MQWRSLERQEAELELETTQEAPHLPIGTPVLKFHGLLKEKLASIATKTQNKEEKNTFSYLISVQGRKKWLDGV